MASAAYLAGEVVARPMRRAAAALASENHSLISDFRRTFVMMKEIAAALEKENKTDLVKELEDAVIELSDAYEDCTYFTTIMQSVGSIYEPGPESTISKQLFKNELTKLKANSSSDTQKDQYLRQFREAIWNVHHAGQPMPGEEEEDVVVTSTQSVLLNTKCPISGKSVTGLQEPVRSMDCKHVYEKQAIAHYMRSSRAPPCHCPIPGCRGILRAARVICDPLLLVDIEEHRSLSRATKTTVVEDFTELPEQNSWQDII